MKRFILSAIICASFSRLTFAESDFQTDAEREPISELVRIQREFSRRRAIALRPLDRWYRDELQALRQTRSGQSPAIQAELVKALASAREMFWQDDQPELTDGLLAASWLWRSDDDADGVAVNFHADGTVEHIGMRGTWRITGPCEVTIRTDDREQFVLRFNASLSAYDGDRRGVSGSIIPRAE